MNNNNCGMHFIYFPKNKVENEFDGEYVYLRRLRIKEDHKETKSNLVTRKHKKPKGKKILDISEEEKSYYEQIAKSMLEKKKVNAKN